MSTSTTDTPRTSRPGRSAQAPADPAWSTLRLDRLPGWSRRGSAPAEPPRPRPPARRSADGRVVHDARLRERRVEVRKDEGRRRRNRLLLGAAVLAVAAAGYVLVQSPLLSVRHLRVVAGRHTTAATIERVGGVHAGTPMLQVDGAAVVARLRRLPWVRTASVRRTWPATVEISVTERTPVAQARSGGRWLLLDATGRVLASRAHRHAGLVQILGVGDAGPGATLASAHGPLRLARALPPSVLDQTEAVVADRAGSLALRLTTGRQVVVGSLAELDAKVVSIVTMLDHLAPLSFCTVDVQVPSAPTLTPASACA